MLVSLPPYGLFVAFAGTKHCCLTAINRCGALCCPDFPRDRGLKQVFFFPYPAIDRHAIYISLTSVIFYGVLLLKLASNSFYLPRASWARGKRRKRCRPKDADKRRSCDKRIPTKSGIRESNPPPRLGKPMHYRCANAAISLQSYYFFFIYTKKTKKYLFFFSLSSVHPLLFLCALARVCVYRCVRWTKNTYICDLRRLCCHFDIPPKQEKYKK